MIIVNGRFPFVKQALRSLCKPAPEVGNLPAAYCFHGGEEYCVVASCLMAES